MDVLRKMIWGRKMRALLFTLLASLVPAPAASGWAAEPTASKVLLLVSLLGYFTGKNATLTILGLTGGGGYRFICCICLGSTEQAAGRSGSTFVGEMLNQARNSFYLYEPCRSLEGEAGVKRFSGKPNVKRCVDLVSRLLDCSFSQSDTDMLFDDFKALNKSNLVRFHRVGPQGLVSDAHRGDRHLAFSKACRAASIRAVKEVRVVEGDSEAVEEGVVAQLLTSGVRVLHLIRDPRGVINSRLALWQFCKAKGVTKCSAEVCASYRHTLDALDHVMKKLFSYTGSDLGPSRHYLRIKSVETPPCFGASASRRVVPNRHLGWW